MKRGVAALLVAACLGAAPASQSRRPERVLAELPIQGDTLRVMATIRPGKGDGWTIENTDAVSIVDRHHRVQFADSLPPFPRPAETDNHSGVHVSAHPVRWGRVRGVVLRRSYSSDTPNDDWREDCRYFALRGRQLLPITPWCNVCGDALPENRVVARQWMGLFWATVPIRLPVEASDSRLVPMPDLDARTNLAVVSTEVGTLEGGPDTRDTMHVVFLYRSPLGEAGDSVLVTPSTPVQFGDAYGKVGMTTTEYEWEGRTWPVTEVDLEMKRMAVVIRGRKGFIDGGVLPLLGAASEE